METFLKLVATDLYGRMKGNLAHTAVVFPNKRASLFFNEYLYKEAGKPIWSPSYITISELFRRHSHQHDEGMPERQLQFCLSLTFL